MLASAIGAAAGSLISGTSSVGLAAIGSLACGPFLVAFAVGVVAGYALYRLDEHFRITDKLSELYDQGLAKLAQVWQDLGAEANVRFHQLANGRLVTDLQQDASLVAQKLAGQADWVRGELYYPW